MNNTTKFIINAGIFCSLKFQLIRCHWPKSFIAIGSHSIISEPGFDPGTCGLWAHHASAAPL